MKNKIKEIYADIIKYFQYKYDISTIEVVIKIKVFVVSLIYIAIALFAQYIESLVDVQYVYGFFFIVITFVFVYLCLKITKNLRQHIKKIKHLRRKYNKNITYPSSFWRGVKVIVIGLAFSILIVYGLNIDFVRESLRSANAETENVSLIQLQILFITLPFIFIIWAFRDKNKLLEIDDTRKDINFKEFQQLQHWTTGNIEGHNSKDNKMSLQLSALHSLRPYLKGEHGDSFRLGTYKIYYSVLQIQYKKILEELGGANKEFTFDNIQSVINNCQLTKQLNFIGTYAAELFLDALTVNKKINQQIGKDTDLSGLANQDFDKNNIVTGILTPKMADKLIIGQ